MHTSVLTPRRCEHCSTLQGAVAPTGVVRASQGIERSQLWGQSREAQSRGTTAWLARGAFSVLGGRGWRRVQQKIFSSRREAAIEAAAAARLRQWMEEDEPNEAAAPSESPLSEKIRVTARLLESGLVERSIEARIMLLAACCGEHILILGPPGTAKSELARRLAHLSGPESVFFERVLTRFSVPEELFGPLSLKALERDEYVRQTAGYLPTATIAFVDEIFKANSAILNTLLCLINERMFDNGAERTPVPLRCLVAASNEPPESEELNALFDRFLFRLSVGPVSDAGVPALVDFATRQREWAQPRSAGPTLSTLSLADVEPSHARTVDVPGEIVGVLTAARRLLAEHETPTSLSDRRLVQAVRMLQMAAWTNGRQQVERADCVLLQHVLWGEPQQRHELKSWIMERVARTVSGQVAAVLSGVIERLDSGAATEDAVRQELEAFRISLVGEVHNVCRQQRLMREHVWLASAEAHGICREMDAKLDSLPACGARMLLAEVARLEAAAELECLRAYARQRRQRGELQWAPTRAVGSTPGAATGGNQAGELSFTLGKHKGRRFSEVSCSDADYCSMLQRKVAEGKFTKDTPLDRQVRAFVAYLQATSAETQVSV
mmetsp:Transcript_75911/g.176043  ORF Transcript_75911/g.176043 Transcript_75911/m.176043 type:complete len:611 (-) Transcript_75911:322-2154(-)